MRAAARFALAASLAVGAAQGGCFLWTSRDDGETLKIETKKLEDRLAKVEGESAEERARLTEMIDTARAQIAELEETLSKATRVLARNSADFGAEMETLKDQLRASDGALAELRPEIETVGAAAEEANRKVVDFALAAGLDLPVDPAKVPEKPGEHFSAIRASFDAGRYGEARELAKLFLQRYPKDEAADDVQFLVARSFVAQKRWAKALGALRQFTDVYPKSELNPEVLYEMASAFFQLGDCTDARILADTIASKHGDSPFAAKARTLQQEMSKQKSRCTS
ncbi:MAG: tetratricopeptide repeat protein [Proteobacteria bacterium]|jgi:TolA-binding protein|nr:tetratricopeptide repeat protein [Pseudomonadota bacterium]